MASISITAGNAANKNLLCQQIEALINVTQRTDSLIELLFAIRTFLTAESSQKHVVFTPLMNVLNREFEHTSYKVMLCQIIPTSNGEQAIATVNQDHNDNEESGSELFDFLMELEPRVNDDKSKKVAKKSNKKQYVTKDGTGKIYNCPFCEKTFTRADYLTRHRRTHTGDRPYVCSFCKKGFADPGNLKRHRRIHIGHKPFKCDICNKAFRTKDKLKRHSSVHTGVRYECHECGKAYSQMESLKTHKEWVHGTENREAGEKRYACPQCDKRFARANYLTKHLHVHNTDRKYACTKCDKRFSMSHGLKRHEKLVHTDSKIIPCTKCNAFFNQKAHLRMHLQNHHKEVEDGAEQKKTKKKKVPTATLR